MSKIIFLTWKMALTANIFSKAYCINLDKRTDRWNAIRAEFENTGITLERFPAISHEIGWKGCTKSHLALIALAEKEKMPYIFIIEDDVVLAENFRVKLDKLGDVPANSQMIFLGGNVYDEFINTKSTEFEWRKTYCLCAHAYVIFANMYSKILECPEDIQIDVFYYYGLARESARNLQSYMAYPMLAFQREGYSDIEGKNVNYSSAFSRKSLQQLECPWDEDEELKIIPREILDIRESPDICIISIYRDKKDLKLLRENLWRQKRYSGKIKVIVVDGSDDRDFPRKFSKEIPFPLQIFTKNASELSYLYNMAIDSLRNEKIIITIMDANNYYMVNSIDIRVKVLLAFPGKKCVGCLEFAEYSDDIVKLKRCNIGMSHESGDYYLHERSLMFYNSDRVAIKNISDNHSISSETPNIIHLLKFGKGAFDGGDYFGGAKFIDGYQELAISIPWEYVFVSSRYTFYDTHVKYAKLSKKYLERFVDKNDLTN